MKLLLLLFAVSVSIVVLAHSFCSIHAMNRYTDHRVRAGVILVAIGSFAELVGVLEGREPDVADLLLLAGLMALLTANRRRNICPCVSRADHEEETHA